MSKKKLLLSTIIFTVISWTSFILVIMRLEPCLVYSISDFCEKTSSLSMILFYTSIFFALTSSFTIIGYASRIYLHNNEVFAAHFNMSLRQAILLTVCILGCTILLTLNLLRWWTTAIIFLTVLFIEFYYLNQERIY
jgi:hypothetical protein